MDTFIFDPKTNIGHEISDKRLRQVFFDWACDNHDWEVEEMEMHQQLEGMKIAR